MIIQHTFSVATTGRSTHSITDQIRDIAQSARIHTGLAHVFVHHTSASLIFCENADPAVRRDLERFMARLIPDGSPWLEHTDEGPDDMPAHIRTILTQTGLTIPVVAGRCALGTWQGVYLWEHRSAGHSRRVTVTVTVTVQGEGGPAPKAPAPD